MKLAAKLALALALAGCLALLGRARRSPTVAPASSSGVAIDEETQLMNGAHLALAAGNTDQAFSLLYEQATKFPKGKLATERELTHMRTLCRAGKAAEARAEAASFLARHAQGPLAERAKAACSASQ
jgi:outer membrane protein assembly factor BamD (BamD/ComL family)